MSVRVKVSPTHVSSRELTLGDWFRKTGPETIGLIRKTRDMRSLDTFGSTDEVKL